MPRPPSSEVPIGMDLAGIKNEHGYNQLFEALLNYDKIHSDPPTLALLGGYSYQEF